MMGAGPSGFLAWFTLVCSLTSVHSLSRLMVGQNTVFLFK